MALSSKPIKIYKREALFIRSKSLPKEVKEDLEEKYTFRFYNEKICQKCEYLPDRHSDVCNNCGAFEGGAKLYKTVKLNDTPYISLPIGDEKNVERALNSHGLRNQDWVSKHKNCKLERKIKFIGTLRDYQPKAVKAMVEYRRGVLESPARTGKTVMGTAAICKIGRKTLILASQRDWLVGFYETFCGSSTQSPLTNAKGSGISDSDRKKFFSKNDHAQVGFCRTLKDFKRHDVCLATIQTFYSEKGMKMLRKLRDVFGAVFVDEIDVGAAPMYSRALQLLNSKWRIGVTGTTDRKDGKYVLIEKIIGPIIYRVKVDRLRPKIHLVQTKFSDPRKNAQWTSYINKIESDPRRLKLIAEWALKDIKNGHMVLIPLARVKVIKALTQAINRLAGKEIAAEFYGGVKKDVRDKRIQLARNYKIKCLVGQSKLLSRGINIPRASAIFDVTMSSNIPNCQQRVSRILTAYEGKPPPILRVFLDDTQVRKSCFRNEWFQCIKKEFKPVISEKDEMILNSWFKQKERQSDLWEL